MTGDNKLSANDIKIWSFVYSVITTFECVVIFKQHPMNVPHKIDELIEFFVDGNHKNCDLAIAYIEDEKRAFERLGMETGFNTFVTVNKFSGIMPYLNADEIDVVVETSMQKFKETLKRRLN